MELIKCGSLYRIFLSPIKRAGRARGTEMLEIGQVIDNKYIDTKMVLDEGIVDGHYYAQLLRAFRYMFEHPEIVETPPSKVVEDIR